MAAFFHLSKTGALTSRGISWDYPESSFLMDKEIADGKGLVPWVPVFSSDWLIILTNPTSVEERYLVEFSTEDG